MRPKRAAAVTGSPPPAPLSRFVGRQSELAEIERLFARGSRLVTIWGLAGMGKTRLATEHALARRAAGDAVLWVPLADRADLAAASAAIARACGVASGGTSDGGAFLGRALAAQGPVLLVLDNLEHLLPELAGTLGAWLERAPSARVLATSRERTRVEGEASLDLAPLALPEGDETTEAVEFFLSRVTEQHHAEPPGKESAARVAALCRALEGIPLAIELAAARFDVLGLEGLCSRLGQRLDLLAKPRRADPRTSTLRGAIEWSWSLLGDDERAALARASLFPSSFSLEAGAAVLADLPTPALELVQSLRDKSLLRLVPGSNDEPPRFALYAAVRELAAEKLARTPGEAALGARLHAKHHLALAEAALARFRRTGEVDALAPIARELEQLLAVAERHPGSEDALSALVCVEPVVVSRGGGDALAARLDRALDGAERTAPPLLVARALGARGRAETLRGAVEVAERDLGRALSLAVAAGDRVLEAELLADLGVLAHRAGDLARAEGLYDRALAVDREAGGSRTEGRTLGNLGALHHDGHRADEAIEYYERALAILALNRDRRLQGIVATNLGTLEQEQGALRAARLRFEQAVELLREIGEVRFLGIALTSLGMLHHEEGRLEEARFCHEQALQKLSVAGDQRSLGLAHARLGALLAALGQLDEGRVALLQATRVAGADEAVRVVADLGHAFAELTVARRAREEGRAPAAKAQLAKAAARMARASSGDPSSAARSDDVRTLLRLLSRGVSAMSSAAADAPLHAGADGAPERALLIAPEGRWFRSPGGPWRDLRKRGPARRLLLRLATAQREAPGAGVSLEALRAAGWPGERMASAAAANRIHVALHQLRAAGLDGALVRTPQGYVLDPTLPVYHVAIEPVQA